MGRGEASCDVLAVSRSTHSLLTSASMEGPYALESEILLTSTFGDSGFRARWAAAIREHGLTVRVWPDDFSEAQRAAVEAGDGSCLDAIESCFCFDPPPGLLAKCRNLRLVHSKGAGVSPGMLEDARVPTHLPLLRICDPLHAQRMAVYVLTAVLSWARRFDEYLAAQERRAWDKSIEDYGLGARDVPDIRCGVMGLGPMGLATAELLRSVGFAVSAWTRGPREVPGISCYHGQEQLLEFASRCDVIVCLVPLTAATRGILNAKLFAALPRGALLVSVSRGPHLVEADLLAALDSGQLSSAVLDVFDTEPLPPESALWAHPRIRITPHVAATTPMRGAVARMVANRERVLRGLPPPPECVIDRARGY